MKDGILDKGQRIAQYEIISCLGRGGMGTVYHVRHSILGTEHALKCLSADALQDSEAVARLQREAKVMAQLDHPNILRVDDFGQSDGTYWIRMELATGISTVPPTLRSLSDLADAQQGQIDQREMVVVILHILDALECAHAAGVVHRDLKPSNILITGAVESKGRELVTVKLADFGLVRLVGEEWVNSQIQHSLSIGSMGTMSPDSDTHQKALVGTYEYMSPEQRNQGVADQRSDIFSLGLLSFKCLTGETPRFKKAGEIRSSLVPEWDDWICTCLETDPQRRYCDARDAANAL